MFFNRALVLLLMVFFPPLGQDENKPLSEVGPISDPLTTKEKSSIFQDQTFWCLLRTGVDSAKTHSDGTLLGKSSSEVFAMLAVVVLHSLLFLHFRATSPCHRHSNLVSQSCEGLYHLWALPSLLWIAFAFSSTISVTVLSGHFLATVAFYYAPLLWHFWHYLPLSRSPWEPAVLPWSFQGFMLILKRET